MLQRCFRKRDELDPAADASAEVEAGAEGQAPKKKPSTITFYPLFLLSLIALCINADQNLVAPNLTQIAREFNFTDEERDYKLGGQLSVGFFLVGGVAAMLVGYLADRMNRRNLLVMVITMGEISTFCTIFVTSYWGLFTTRAITGVSIGGSNPLLMSMIGDMYNDSQRGKAIAVITIMFTLGVGLGQSVAGFIGAEDAFGWRAPFAVMALPVFILGPILLCTTEDPPRGGKERVVEEIGIGDEIGEATRVPIEHVYEEKMDLTKLKKLCRNVTAVLAFFQGIPGSLPWGVILVYFQDYLVQDVGPTVPGGISVQQSSIVILCFGIGASIGTALGGWLSDRIWRVNPRGVTLLMGITAVLAALPIYGVVNSPPSSVAAYSAIFFPCGVIAGIIGPAIRTVLMNVTLPETRGTAFAFHTLFDDIGKGLGPLWVSLFIAASGSRVAGFNVALTGWIVCGLIMLIMCCTVMRDLKKLEIATIEALQRRGIAITAPGGLGGISLTNFGTISPVRSGKVEDSGAAEARAHQRRSSSNVVPMSLGDPVSGVSNAAPSGNIERISEDRRRRNPASASPPIHASAEESDVSVNGIVII